ncbi:MAG: hypothetical protein HYZ90_07360 [Candidatus Omnitrophica bacterium]|nr:hypothetical protein [Candidatus Omnitrophota bacterium]
MSDSKRRYLAEICAKIVEFVISILLIGQLVTGRLSVRMIFGAGFIAVGLILLGVWLTPDGDSVKKGVG